MKATAFAPGHISCFFEPVYHLEDFTRTGSRGAGINTSLGVISEVFAQSSTVQNIDVYINNKRSPANVTRLALKYLIGENPLNIVVKTKQSLPMGQGFGMSAAGALSATMAMTRICNVTTSDAMKASHFAEVKLRTGLGDVIAGTFGGIELRKSPGLPPWGLIEHIPGDFNLVLCVVGKRIDTGKVLNDKSKADKIMEYGQFCVKKILENPSVENLFYLSNLFTKKTGLADKRVLDAINAANNFGTASMCMLGNSVFAMGETDKLVSILSKFGRVYVCNVDQTGARVL